MDSKEKIAALEQENKFLRAKMVELRRLIVQQLEDEVKANENKSRYYKDKIEDMRQDTDNLLESIKYYRGARD